MNIEKKPSKVLKFAPVKLLVIESRGEYYRTVACAIGVGLSHVFLGAVIMVTFMYSLQTGDIHAILCTVGYQFFSSEAILSLCYVNGWSSQLRLTHRKCAHIVLQVCAICCVICGIGILISPKGLSSSNHCITGMVSVCLTLLCIITGPLGLHEGQDLKFVHMGFGIPTFCMSSTSVCLGFYTSEFAMWTDTVIAHILTVLVIFYTLCICTVILIHGIFHTK